MSESKTQSQILQWLEKHGFYCVKTIVSNKKGVPDILACSPKGRFIGIEVKYGNNKPSKLQEYHMMRINQTGGLAFAAWDLETVVHKLQGELSETD